MLTELQKLAAQAIVNVFETGRARGDYSRVTVLPGDTGHLTYGRSQTTLSSGNLFLLIDGYCAADGALLATALRPFLPALREGDTRLDRDTGLHRLLREAGRDPVMRRHQDRFFDAVYWEPGVAGARALGVEGGLGTGVVYDSHVHGSWRRMRDRTLERHGTPGDLGERDWIRHYVRERRDWLATHSNELLHRTVYRMDSFDELMRDGRWELELPFRVRGVRIDEDVLTAEPGGGSAEDPAERLLLLRDPRLEGDDVRAVQEALVDAGFDVVVDGVYGPRTTDAVEEFQRRAGLKVDGIVGPVTRARLELGD